jgi:hypothetical protein
LGRPQQGIKALNMVSRDAVNRLGTDT